MTVDKISISFDAELGEEVRAAARRAGTGLSAWIANAAQAQLRSEALREFLDEWQAEHGPITAEELARAEEELGIVSSRSSAKRTSA